MNRRNFLRSSLAAGGAALFTGPTMMAAAEGFQDRVPGVVAESEIEGARFPDGFLWGMASAALSGRSESTFSSIFRCT